MRVTKKNKVKQVKKKIKIIEIEMIEIMKTDKTIELKWLDRKREKEIKLQQKLILKNEKWY